MLLLEPTPVATIKFNTAATREFFASERVKGLRLRIDRGVVSFHAVTPSRGDDVIAIRRLSRGVIIAIEHNHHRLFQRLIKAGLTTDQPYFLLATTVRGWFNIEHYPSNHPPQRQSVMEVSGFASSSDAAINLAHWQRFFRSLVQERPIDAELWQTVRDMILRAHRLTERPRRGRMSRDRQNAQKMLASAKRNITRFLAWRARESDYAEDITELVTTIMGEPPPAMIPAKLDPVNHDNVTRTAPEHRRVTPRRRPPIAPVILD